MKRRVILVIASVVLVVGLLLGSAACAPAPAEGKTLKIGMIEALNWPVGVDAMHAVELDIERENENGGLLIGGERYKLELIVDDNKMDPALSKTVAEKQIFQDEIKFIVGDGFSVTYLDLVNDNKVVAVASQTTPEILYPEYHYCFHGNVTMTSWVSLINWAAAQYPDIDTIICAFPDRLDGRAYAPFWEHAAEVAGLTVLDSIFYPPEQTDQSAVGTKVKTENPDLLVPFGGGPDVDSIIVKACYVAGWKGQIFDTATIPARVLAAIASNEATEGMLLSAWPAEFEPAATEMAAEFKADWIAKYGEWTDPEVSAACQWWVLKAGLQAASNPDPDEVADMLASGLEFEAPMGKARMVSRPDFGNPRTVQVIFENFIKRIEGGEPKLIDTMSVQEVYDYCKLDYDW